METLDNQYSPDYNERGYWWCDRCDEKYDYYGGDCYKWNDEIICEQCWNDTKENIVGANHE